MRSNLLITRYDRTRLSAFTLRTSRSLRAEGTLRSLRTGAACQRDLQLRLMAGDDNFLAVEGEGAAGRSQRERDAMIRQDAARPLLNQRSDIDRDELIETGTRDAGDVSASRRRTQRGALL